MDKIKFSIQYDRLDGVFGNRSERQDAKVAKMDEYYKIFKNTKEEHLENAVSYLINNHAISRLPLPSDIWQALVSSIPKGGNDFNRIDNGCERCDGSGYVFALKDYGIYKGNPLISEFAFRCNCSAGKMRGSQVLEWSEYCQEKGHKLKWET